MGGLQLKQSTILKIFSTISYFTACCQVARAFNGDRGGLHSTTLHKFFFTSHLYKTKHLHERYHQYLDDHNLSDISTSFKSGYPPLASASPHGEVMQTLRRF